MPSDSEKTTERFNLKVSGDVLDWIKDEQHRQRKITGKQPTQNEVMLDLIERKRGSKIPEKSLAFESSQLDNVVLSDENRKYLEMCVAVLTSGNEVALKAVKSNLDLFYLFIQRDPHAAQLALPSKRTRSRS